MELVRSGDFSLDPIFDPNERFAHTERDESTSLISAAFNDYLTDGDLAKVERAIAIFVRASRERGHAVEQVVRQLDQLQTTVEGIRNPILDEPSALRRSVLRGVLLAFYGPEAMAREERRRAERVAHMRREQA
jgi:hypothetical protein